MGKQKRRKKSDIKKKKRRMEENARKHTEETKKCKELDEYKPYRIERLFAM